MANQIRIKTSVEIVQDVGASAGAQNGITYTSESLDGNADYRAWGGSYNESTAYGDNDVAYWKNVIVSTTSADGLDNSYWTEASDVTDGTLPTNVYVVAVEFVEQAIGNDGTITVTINAQPMAVLVPGESIVLPLDGVAIANVKIKTNAYSNGVTEPKVNVMVAGT